MSPSISITYCTQCNWLLRAAWMAQELLQTFGQDLGEVALRPGTGGVLKSVFICRTAVKNSSGSASVTADFRKPRC